MTKEHTTTDAMTELLSLDKMIAIMEEKGFHFDCMWLDSRNTYSVGWLHKRGSLNFSYLDFNYDPIEGAYKTMGVCLKRLAEKEAGN